MNFRRTTTVSRLVKTALFLGLVPLVAAQTPQKVEGFDQIEFHHQNKHIGVGSRDFRGSARGYLTAAWWAPGQMKDNRVAWKTAVVRAKQATTFSFIAATSVLPSEFSRGPQAKLTINGHYALTFTLGVSRDFTWKEGDYELKYVSKRVDYPYSGWERQRETHGNSGFYHLTVPGEALEAGQPAILQVEILPFPGWSHGWFMIKERRDVLTTSQDSLAGELEALRKDMARLNEQTHILATQTYPELVGGDRFAHSVIYTNGFRHIHPADLVKLQNGELLIMAREATEHFAQDGDVVMLRSKDGGRTWGERQVIAAIKDFDEREGCGVQLRDGTIVVGIFYNGLYNPDGSYGLKTREPGKRYLGTYTIASKDNGHTWTEPRYLDLAGMPFNGTEGPTDAPIEMPDGSLLMGLIGYNLNGDPKNNGSVMMRSTDQGATWQYLSTIADDPDGKIGALVEPGIVRTKSGRIIAGLRVPDHDAAVRITYSDDDGKTWSPLQKTAMIGHPVDLIQLADGRIMASYGVRPRLHLDPGGIRVCFSRDNGATWDISTELQLRNDFLNFDTGYPESLEFPDGSILTVYYYNLFGKYFLGGTRRKP